MRGPLILFTALVFAVIGMMQPDVTNLAAAPQQGRISVRTENFPRPPYSGATYYFYERDGEVICTKLEVCNKYDNCSTQYKKGKFKEEEDIEHGEPSGKTEPVLIPSHKLRRHVCLMKFKFAR